MDVYRKSHSLNICGWIEEFNNVENNLELIQLKLSNKLWIENYKRKKWDLKGLIEYLIEKRFKLPE